jgi:uncharacterized protein (TIGR00251 family)
MSPSLPLATTKDGVVVMLRVTPRAGRDAIGTTTQVGEGTALSVRVAAPPVDGAANAAIVRLLAKSWRLPVSSFEIVAGESGRLKRVLVRGEPETILRILTERLAA